MSFLAISSSLLKNQSQDVVLQASRERRLREQHRKTEASKLLLSQLFWAYYKHKKSILQCRELICSGDIGSLASKHLQLFLTFVHPSHSVAEYNSLYAHFRRESISKCILFILYGFGLSTSPLSNAELEGHVALQIIEKIAQLIVSLDAPLVWDSPRLFIRFLEISVTHLTASNPNLIISLLKAHAFKCPEKMLLFRNTQFIGALRSALLGISSSHDAKQTLGFCSLKSNKALSESSMDVWDLLYSDDQKSQAALLREIIFPVITRTNLLLEFEHFSRLIHPMHRHLVEYLLESSADIDMSYFLLCKWILESFVVYLNFKSELMAQHLYNDIHQLATCALHLIFHHVWSKNIDAHHLAFLKDLSGFIPLEGPAASLGFYMQIYILCSCFNIHCTVNVFCNGAEIHLEDNLVPDVDSILLALFIFLKVLNRQPQESETRFLAKGLLLFKRSLEFSIANTSAFFYKKCPAFYFHAVLLTSAALYRLICANKLTVSYLDDSGKRGSFLMIPNCEHKVELSDIVKFILENSDTSSVVFKRENSMEQSHVDLQNTEKTMATLFLTSFFVLIPIETRIKLLRDFLFAEFQNLQTIPPEEITIRRSRCFVDGLKHFIRRQHEMPVRRLFHISFLDEYGNPDLGQDGGGLFRQFIAASLAYCLDPNLGLFEVHESKFSASLLYPSENVGHLDMLKELDSYAYLESEVVYRYIGTLLGHLVLRNLSLSGCTAGNFPSAFWAQVFSFRHYKIRESWLLDIKEFDAEFLYHLLELPQLLKTEQDLCIFDEQGVLINISNVDGFIFSSIHNKLYRKYIQPLASGFLSIVPTEIFRLFTPTELAIIINGRRSIDPKTGLLSRSATVIDLNDWQNNVVYSPPFSKHHPTIEFFWEVLSSWSQDDLSRLLRFCTGYGSPPFNGFSGFNPLFCVGFFDTDQMHLPTASTCINMLRLPEYSTKEMLSDRLKAALQCQDFLLT